MSKPKKTLSVETLKTFVNEQLKRTDDHANVGNFKSGLCIALERVLHDSGNYRGFTYLFWDEGGCEQWRADGQTEIWSEKRLYVLGDANSKYKQNEYARRYY